MKNVFLILFAIMFLQCSKPCENCGTGRIMENYVIRYINPDSAYMSVRQSYEDSLDILFEINIRGTIINPVFPENDNMLAEFHKIAADNGDTAYNRPLATCFPYVCFANGESHFNIYCDKQYLEYPAGTSLNEIFLMYSMRADLFVKSGYMNTDLIKSRYTPLIQFNEEKPYLLSATHSLGLVLNRKPTDTQEYTFHIVYSDKTNCILKDSIMINQRE